TSSGFQSMPGGVTPYATILPPHSTPRIMRPLSFWTFGGISFNGIRIVDLVPSLSVGGLDRAAARSLLVPDRPQPRIAFPVGVRLPQDGEVAFGIRDQRLLARANHDLGGFAGESLWLDGR